MSTQDITTPASITSANMVNAAEWDELAARMNGGAFPVYIHTISLPSQKAQMYEVWPNSNHDAI